MFSNRTFPSLALGAVLALALAWSLGVWRVTAAPNQAQLVLPSVEGAVFEAITPVRILDSRDGNDVGLAGPFSSQVPQDLQVTGSVPTSTSAAAVVVPERAVGVSLNVTVVGATANGFVSIRPADAPGVPTTSNLNFSAGDVVPNAVTVRLPRADTPDDGRIEIAYDAHGVRGPTTNILIDVVGYFVLPGEQVRVVDHGSTYTPVDPGPTTLRHHPGYTEASGDGVVMMELAATTSLGGVPQFPRLVEYCIQAVSGGAFVAEAQVFGELAPSSSPTDRDAPGCFSIDPNGRLGPLVLEIGGGPAARIELSNVRSQWRGFAELSPAGTG